MESKLLRQARLALYDANLLVSAGPDTRRAGEVANRLAWVVGELARLEPKPIPIPADLDTPEFRAAWDEWLAERAARRKKVTPRAAKQQLGLLAPLGPAAAVECIRASIVNGWTGLFPEKHQPGVARPAAADRAHQQDSRIVAQLMEGMAGE